MRCCGGTGPGPGDGGICARGSAPAGVRGCLPGMGRAQPWQPGKGSGTLSSPGGRRCGDATPGQLLLLRGGGATVLVTGELCLSSHWK